MPDDLPSCSEFILAAIRNLRVPPSRRQTAPNGVGLHRLWSVVKAVPYTTDEFRAALLSLIEADTIKVIGGRSVYGSQGETGNQPIIFKRNNLPTWYKFDFSFFETTYEGGSIELPESKNVFEWNEKVRHIDHIFWHIGTLYIVADGLPKKVLNIDAPKAGASERAKAILAKMTQQSE